MATVWSRWIWTPSILMTWVGVLKNVYTGDSDRTASSNAVRAGVGFSCSTRHRRLMPNVA
jgi:hypothetical protein